MNNFKQNLMERSIEIKFLIEKELRILKIPCSVSDMVKRVHASRMPVEKHLKSLLASEDFSDISIARVGGVDVIYRIPNDSHSIMSKDEDTKTVEVNIDGNKTDRPTDSNMGGSRESGYVEQ